MTLFDYYLQYMTQVWEGKRPAPEGITLPEDGDEAARIQALGRQLQAMGMADFVRACAAQDGTVLPEELFVTESSDLGGFQVFLQGTETPEAAPETPTAPEAPAQPPEPDPDAGKHAFEVFLDWHRHGRWAGAVPHRCTQAYGPRRVLQAEPDHHQAGPGSGRIPLLAGLTGRTTPARRSGPAPP